MAHTACDGYRNDAELSCLFEDYHYYNAKQTTGKTIGKADTISKQCTHKKNPYEIHHQGTLLAETEKCKNYYYVGESHLHSRNCKKCWNKRLHIA